MQITFRSDKDQLYWAYTNGLHALEQRKMAVSLPWPEQNPRNMLVTHLLQFFEGYLISQPKRILPGQTSKYGWTTLRFVSDEHNLSGLGTETLLIEEIQAPFSQEDASYISGIASTIALMQLQEDAMQRNHITGNVLYPHRSHYAIACTRITPETVQHLRPLIAHRAWKPNAQNSGWFIGCTDQKHIHDNPDELVMIHLIHIVKHFPGLFPYLAMPVGIQLLFEQNQVIVFRPDEQESLIDPGTILSSLP